MSTDIDTETDTYESVDTGEREEVLEAVESAASCVGKAWPLHSFVTANPLAGFEDEEFHEAVEKGKSLFGASGYPDVSVFRGAWEEGRIYEEVLRQKLSKKGYDDTELTSLLDRMEEDAPTTRSCPEKWEEVDAVLSKWLAAFFDQGCAEWSMPNREEGFYAAWREVAPHDGQLPDLSSDLPESPAATVESFVSEYPAEDWEGIFRSQFASLPGWTSLIRWRAESDDPWQSECPITIVGYLAVRLAVSDALDVPLKAGVDADTDTDASAKTDELRLAWLEAWEETYRESLTEALPSEPTLDADDEPDAQLVFCIDTRSEIIRRHVESAGCYETHGYAGFFGVPMRYEGYGSEVAVDSHPPILEPAHHVYEKPDEKAENRRRGEHDFWSTLEDSVRSLAETLETNAATAFSYVEKAGVGYGVAMTARTLLPSAVYDVSETVDSRVPDTEEFCAPTVDSDSHDHTFEADLPVGMTLEEKVEYAANAFELMGWEEFARLVVFVGHSSQTTNNPFDSALDCGACAANPGGPNARVLTAICNDEEVRSELHDRGIQIPDDTVFVAGEHNTTTDEITLFDNRVPESHRKDVEDLRGDLREARENAAEERAVSMGAKGDGVRETERRAADWAETRPEWGLAGNAAFVIGPRSLTKDANLDGRVFLHSYDSSTDPDGDALEAIMLGPMVVTQWINSQYYFASVDNAVYGSGSKVTQNPVGNVGVFQGNGGDVMTGLPLQSLDAADDEPYHQPIRLSVVIHAPTERVTEILETNEHLKTLVENGWLHLSVLDPEKGNRIISYAEMETDARRAEKGVAETETSAQD